jgi:hypothetical protein
MFAASKSGRAGGATDPYFSYVPLLLETTSTNGQQNNTFLDSTTTNTITRAGTTNIQGSFNPYRPDGYWSNYLGVSGNYITNTGGNVVDFGLNDFTVEYWAYYTAAPTGTYEQIVGQSTSATGISFGANASGQINVTTLTVPASGTTILPRNQWIHVAFVATGGATRTIRGYINGVLDLTSSSFATSFNTTGFTISNSTYYTTAYVSNIRIIKNQALITGTGNFTPPTNPLTTSTVGWAGTNVASSITGTVSLLTCQSNRFKDNSSNLTLAPTGTPKVQVFQPFSPPASYTAAAYGGSIYNITKTDGLTTPNTASLSTFTGNFTIECWVYPTDISLTGSFGILDARNTAGQNAQWAMGLSNYVSSSGWLVDFFLGIGNDALFGLRVPPNAWSHIVLQRNSGTIRAFVNGVVDTITYAGGVYAATITGIASANPLTINNTKDSSVAGYGNIGYTSNLRIVNGTAVYAITGFTPPTAPVTAIANTSLLLNYTNAGIYDAAAQNNATTEGDAQTSTTQKQWSPTSMKFDGAGDYLYIPWNPSLELGSGNFTIEFWTWIGGGNSIYCWSTDYHYALSYNYGGANANRVGVWASSNGSGWNIFNADPSGNGISTGTISTSTWTHVALVRSGSSWALFLSGSRQWTGTSSATIITRSTDTFRIGGPWPAGGPTVFSGYIQDFRMTNGIARYNPASTTITVPTAAFPTR